MTEDADPPRVRPSPGPPRSTVRYRYRLGRLAQLVERRPYKAEVGGSRPSAPTLESLLDVEHLVLDAEGEPGLGAAGDEVQLVAHRDDGEAVARRRHVANVLPAAPA